MFTRMFQLKYRLARSIFSLRGRKNPAHITIAACKTLSAKALHCYKLIIHGRRDAITSTSANAKDSMNLVIDMYIVIDMYK